MNVPPLHVVVTDEVAGRAEFERIAEELLLAGGTELALHLRLRAMDGGDLFRVAERLSVSAAGSGGWCVVNGRVDVALAAGSQAVQLGRGALPVPQVLQVLNGRAAVGASIHSAEEARLRAAEGAHYLLAGTVFESATHPGRAGGGPSLIGGCAVAGVPVVGIGGIDRHNATSVMTAGAVGVAVVRAVWDRPDPIRAAAELLEIVRAATSAGT